MFFKNYQFMFLFSLFSGTMIAVSSNSWFTSWLGLEINLLSMIPLMLSNINKNFTEAAIKYFLAQALASLFLIFAIMANFFYSENVFLEITEIFIILSLSLKGGLAPFHFWFPQVSNLLNWVQCFIIFTWQKIAPLLLMFSFNMKIIFLISTISAMTGALGGLNQNLIKVIMAYSSISHAGWMLLGCSLSVASWFVYFSIYLFLSAAIITFFLSNQIIKMKQIFNCSDSNANKYILFLNIFSLGGLPPLMGFAAKMTILTISFKMKIVMIFVPLITSSILSLFFYSRMIYSNLMNITLKMNETSIFNKSPSNILFSSSILFNIFIPMILALS